MRRRADFQLEPARLLREISIVSDAGEAFARCVLDQQRPVPQPPARIGTTLFPTLADGERADAVEAC